MDKNEYNLLANEIRTCVNEKKYAEAVKIADTIDWRNVRSSNMLCYISDLYKMCRRFEDSRDVLMLAYQRNPSGRMILYSLCELSIKIGDIVAATEYFKEFKRVAPRDSGKFVLLYKLYTAQEVGMDERIGVLEQLQEDECKEKWMYELAYLYHMQGYGEKCVDECNQIILYFGEGKYVIKALELKRLHEPLSYEQDSLYKRLTDTTATDILIKDMDVSKFNTIDLQKELANSLAEVLYDDSNAVKSENTSYVKAESYPAEEVSVEEILVEEVPSEAVSKDVVSLEENSAEAVSPVEITSDNKAFYDVVKEEKEHAETVLEETSPLTDVTETEKETEIAFEDVKEKTVNDVINITKEEIRKEEAAKEKKETITIGETRIFNIGDIESALKPEPGMARTVLPSRGFDEMREVMPREHKNPAIKYSNFDDMVSLEGDGQISFNIPEQEMIDKQITGQISIDEIMAEWERMKKANEKKWADDMRRKVTEQADVMFADFDKSSKDGYLEMLENEVSESDVIVLTKEEEEHLLEDNISHVAMGINIISDDAKLNEDLTLNNSDSNYLINEDKEDAIDSEAGSLNVEAEDSFAEAGEVIEEESENHDIREIRIDEIEAEPSSEELFFDRTPYINIEERLSDIPTEAEPVSADNTTVLPNGTEIDYLLAYAEASERSDKAYLEAISKIGNEITEILPESLEPEVDEAVKESAVNEASVNGSAVNGSAIEETEVIEEPVVEEIEVVEEPVVEEVEVVEESLVEEVEAVEEPVVEEVEVVEESLVEEVEVAEEPVVEEVEVVEEPVVEEVEVVEEPVVEEVEATEEPEAEEVAEEPEAEEVEAAEEPETEETEVIEDSEPYGEDGDAEDGFEGEKESSVLSSGSNVRESGFTAEQEHRFEAFIQTEAGREQLKEVLENISMEADHGNVIIGSEDIDSSVELAKAILMELSDKNRITGKVAKIKASTLNAKDSTETLKKLSNGALIIQDAGELRRETLDAIRRAVIKKGEKLFIILTITKRAKHNFIMHNNDMLESFNVSIDIDALSDKELAAYAKGYAFSKEYSIDEMGMLALQTRIDEKQTNEHSVTITEVRSIVDAAIKNATKKNVKHFVDVLVGKRYDDNDMIVLKEKDFME